ncbi:MAG TPA: site-2 protease family protein [Terriglobales bacterium]
MPDNPLPPLVYQAYDPGPKELRVWPRNRPKQRYWLHLLLFLATCLSTLSIGARLEHDFRAGIWPYSDDDNFLPWSWALEDWHRLADGVPFSACLLGILTAHEFGHYVLCRRRGVEATLPFFIPFPSLIGTLGAVIRIKSPIRSRKDLFDIGIAGPIAGFVVAVPVLVVSLLYSKPLTLQPPENGWPVLGFPLIFDLVRWILAFLGSQSPAAHLSANHLYLAPTAIAAWVGMLATALNLLPGGQLDGGHIIFALNPRAHRWVSRSCILALLVFSWYLWVGWLVWAILLRITGSRHPVVPAEPGLGRGSRMLSLVAAILLLLTWMPAPLPGTTLPEAAKSISRGVSEGIHNWRHPSK